MPQTLLRVMQVLPQLGGEAPASFTGVARDLLRREGAHALWSGLGARLLTIGPGAALSWTIYEEVHRWLRGS